MKRTALLTLVLVAACGGGGGSKATGPAVATQGDPSAQTVTLDMGDQLKFSPNVVKAKAGTVTFTVVNTGLVPHNFIVDGNLGKTGSIDGKTTKTLKVTFTTPGTYSFECSFHPGMTGKVTVS